MGSIAAREGRFFRWIEPGALSSPGVLAGCRGVRCVLEEWGAQMSERRAIWSGASHGEIGEQEAVIIIPYVWCGGEGESVL